jgi:uncharacterized NAD(P)/FAD-binding protein YdhS
VDSGQLYDTVIVGGGLAGSTVAVELARLAPAGFRTLVIDSQEPGPGCAYAPPSDRLYMNGTAVAMSADPNDPRSLVRWLGDQADGRRNGGTTETAPISRPLFGRYLAERFRQALERRPEFSFERAEVVDLIAEGSLLRAIQSGGRQIVTRTVILALGNFPPSDAFLPESLRRHPGFVPNPWRFDLAPETATGDVLLIGSGLTALDTIALLDERGFSGRVHLLSRHGLMPCVDNPLARALPAQSLQLDTATPYALLRSLRAAADRHRAEGGDWREVVESIRSASPLIWSSWSLRERRRFLRHLQAFWAVHRYRVPPETAAVAERLAAEGRLRRHRGRVSAAAGGADGRLRVEIAGPEGMSAVVVTSAMNCTGPNGDYRTVAHPLVRNLLRRGLIRPDALALGLDADDDLRVLDRSGRRSECIFALGPPVRGRWYETTAVPETRAQAARIARDLAHGRAVLEAAS